MKRLDYQVGLIDLIKGIDNNYYFLEVNPSGQYSDMSEYCNLYLEKKVATYLMKASRQIKRLAIS